MCPQHGAVSDRVCEIDRVAELCVVARGEEGDLNGLFSPTVDTFYLQ